MNTDINLLPQKNNILRSEQTLMRVRIFAILSVVITISAAVGIFLINKVSSPENLKVQQDSLTASLQTSQKKAIAQLQLIDRLNHIQNILSSRSKLENNLSLVEKQIPDNVTIQAISLDEKVLRLSVNSADLNAINSVILNMTNLLNSKKFMQSMTVENVVADQKTGKFLLSLDAKL